MQKERVFNYFKARFPDRKTQAVIHEVTGYSRQAISQWTDIVPPRAAIKLWEFSDGELRLDSKAWD